MASTNLFTDRIDWSTMTPDSHPMNSSKKPSRSKASDDPFVETNLASETSRYIRTPLGFALKPTAPRFKPRLPPRGMRRAVRYRKEPYTPYSTPKSRAHDLRPGCDLDGLTMVPPLDTPPAPDKAIASVVTAFMLWRKVLKTSGDLSELLASQDWSQRLVQDIESTEEEWNLFCDFSKRELAKGKAWTEYVVWKL